MNQIVAVAVILATVLKCAVMVHAGIHPLLHPHLVVDLVRTVAVPMKYVVIKCALIT